MLKAKSVMQQVVAAGGQLIRTKGSHYIYRLSNGRNVVVPHTGRRSDLPTGIYHKIMKELKAAYPR